LIPWPDGTAVVAGKAGKTRINEEGKFNESCYPPGRKGGILLDDGIAYAGHDLRGRSLEHGHAPRALGGSAFGAVLVG